MINEARSAGLICTSCPWQAGHDLRGHLALRDVALGRIVTARHVGEPYAQRRTMLAGIAPELGAVGEADTQQVVGVGVEPVSSSDDQDIAVLGGDDAPGDPGSIGCVGDDGRERDRQRVGRELLVTGEGCHCPADEASDHQRFRRFCLLGDGGGLVEDPRAAGEVHLLSWTGVGQFRHPLAWPAWSLASRSRR